MRRESVSSSNLAAVGYDEKEQMMNKAQHTLSEVKKLPEFTNYR